MGGGLALSAPERDSAGGKDGVPPPPAPGAGRRPREPRRAGWGAGARAADPGGANLSGCSAPACRRRRWCRCRCGPASGGRAAGCAAPAAGTAARRSPGRRPPACAAPPRQACWARGVPGLSLRSGCPLPQLASPPSPPKPGLSRQAAPRGGQSGAAPPPSPALPLPLRFPPGGGPLRARGPSVPPPPPPPPACLAGRAAAPPPQPRARLLLSPAPGSAPRRTRGLKGAARAV